MTTELDPAAGPDIATGDGKAVATGIVIVNYRTAALAVDCLRSLAPEVAASPATRVVVVDNASGDGSLERLTGAIAAEGWGGWARAVDAGGNRGFSAGNNVGLRLLLAEPAPPDWLWLLNPDTVVRPGALQALLRRGQARPDIGVVGSGLEDPDGTPQRPTFRFPSLGGELDRGLRFGPLSRWLGGHALGRLPTEACQVDWVSGASLLIRRQTLLATGLMDEGFFLYFEEVDLCRRAADSGWSCWYEPAARVVHLEGQSTGVAFDVNLRRTSPWILESRRRYLLKHHGLVYAALADLTWVVAHLAWRLGTRLQGRRLPIAPHLLADFLHHSVLTRGGRL
jgi:GT2 family glycosyltransferase